MAGNNTGNIGNNQPKKKRELNPIKPIKEGIIGLEKDVNSLTTLATKKIEDITNKLDSMSGDLSDSVKDLNKSVVSISDVISSAFKRTRNDLSDIDKDAQAIYDRQKRQEEELNKVRTKRAKQRLQDRFDEENRLIRQREEVAKRILETRESGGKESDKDREDYRNATNELKKFQEQELAGSLGIVETVANKAVDVFKNVAQDVLKYFTDNLSKGITDAVNWNIQNYTEIAGKTGSAEDTIKNIKDLTNAYNKSGYGSAVNINNELKPMYLELARQGLQGENLRDTAITNAIDKKVMPWLENTSQYWITLSDNLGTDAMNIIKGQQLYLRETESGNRLLQTGVISQLTQQMTPLLQSIKDDVFATAHSEEIYQLAQGFVEGGYTPEQAQQMASKYIEMQKNPYQAVSSGDVSTTLMALSYARGDSALETFRQLGDIAGRGQSSNIFASSAYAGTFAPFLPTQTREGLKQFSDTTAKFDQISKHTDNSNKYLKEIRDNTKNYVSKADRLENTFQNGLVGLGDTFSGAYTGKLLGTTATSLLGLTGAIKLGKGIFNKLGGAGLGSPNAVNGFGNVGNFVNTQATSGGLASSLRVAGGVAGGVTFLATTGHDIYKGYKQGDRGWELARDALTGTEQSGSNTLKQMGKYAGLGALIGSFVGPGGTLIGAGIGAGAGALISLGAKKREEQNVTESVTQMSQSGLGDAQTLVTILTTINENLTNGTAKVTVSNVSTDPFVRAGFGNANTSKDNIEKSDNKLEDDGTYRAELLEKITAVGTEIVEAIYGSGKPSNIKENYFLNGGMEISPDVAKIAGLVSTTGMSNSDK